MKNTIRMFGIIAMSAVIVLSMAACGDDNNNNGSDVQINVAAIPVAAPARGSVPVTTTETTQYTGAVAWSPAVSGTFAAETAYTATITLTPKKGFTLQGVAANFFTVAGASTPATNSANSGVVTAEFPATGAAPWTIPADYDFSIEVFNGAVSLGVIDVSALKNLEQVTFTTTSASARKYPGYLLTDVLEAAGISIPAYSKAEARPTAPVPDPDDVTDIANITQAYMVLARIDTNPIETNLYPRIIAETDGTFFTTNGAVRRGFEKLVFTPAEWEIPADYEFNNIEVFNGTNSIGVIDVDAIKYIKQEKLIATSGREYAGYLLTDVLYAAGVSVPVHSKVEARPTDPTPTNIEDIEKAYLIVARIDTGNLTEYKPVARMITDGTGEFSQGQVMQGFEKLVFNP